MPTPQTIKNHTRYFPLYHFFVAPVLAINFFIQARKFLDDMTFDTGWTALVALALLGLGFAARIQALIVQNRLIRLEERLRLSRLMPAEEQAGIDRLSTRHLVGLRFASDAEAADLARRCVNGELTTAKAVKEQVKTWRPDYLRA